MAIRNFYTTGHTIERLTVSQDEHGGITETWEEHLTPAGKLWQLRGDERLSADKTTFFADHQFNTDIADIKKTDRYKDAAGNVYTIKDNPTRTRPDGTGHMELSLEKVT